MAITIISHFVPRERRRIAVTVRHNLKNQKISILGETIDIWNEDELKPTIKKIIISLFLETDRGAVIIGTEIMNELLLEFVIAIFPEMSKEKLHRLIKYPGPLSSFASKIELSYAFRLIGKNLYDSLNELRKLRNKAAHSQEKFSLNKFDEKISEIVNLGPNMSSFIRSQATKALYDYKINRLADSIDKEDMSNEEKSKMLKTIVRDKETQRVLDEQIPHWYLVNGLITLAGLINHRMKKTYEKIGDAKVLSEIE